MGPKAMTETEHDEPLGNACTAIARVLAGSLQVLAFPSVSHVYNPLIYRWAAHHEYLQRYGNRTGRVLLVGMISGPWGMTQPGQSHGQSRLGGKRRSGPGPLAVTARRTGK
jgi:hypothetical protein